MKNIAIISSGDIGCRFDTSPLTNARSLEPHAELGIRLAYGKGHGGEIGFTSSFVN